jgi:hypothetical protein
LRRRWATASARASAEPATARAWAAAPPAELLRERELLREPEPLRDEVDLPRAEDDADLPREEDDADLLREEDDADLLREEADLLLEARLPDDDEPELPVDLDPEPLDPEPLLLACGMLPPAIGKFGGTLLGAVHYGEEDAPARNVASKSVREIGPRHGSVVPASR